jgi:hypothetical protein
MRGGEIFTEIPDIRDLGEQLDVGTAELLGALYRAEHTLQAGTAEPAIDDPDLDFETGGVLLGIGTGHTEQCAVWPSDAEIEAHRRHVVERILITDVPNRKAS